MKHSRDCRAAELTVYLSDDLPKSISPTTHTKFKPHLNPTKVPRQTTLPKLTGHLHGYKSADYYNYTAMPKMYGPEKYAYYVLDITDPEYRDEVMDMSEKLSAILQQQVTLEVEWRKAYKEFIRAESALENLPEVAAKKFNKQYESDLKTAHVNLLAKQKERDLMKAAEEAIFARCTEIKRKIKESKALDELSNTIASMSRTRSSQDESNRTIQY